jgi:hypothetical protein
MIDFIFLFLQIYEKCVLLLLFQGAHVDLFIFTITTVNDVQTFSFLTLRRLYSRLKMTISTNVMLFLQLIEMDLKQPRLTIEHWSERELPEKLSEACIFKIHLQEQRPPIDFFPLFFPDRFAFNFFSFLLQPDNVSLFLDLLCSGEQDSITFVLDFLVNHWFNMALRPSLETLFSNMRHCFLSYYHGVKNVSDNLFFFPKEKIFLFEGRFCSNSLI